jgi:quercetin dioxygenase-like cupin family protein
MSRLPLVFAWAEKDFEEVRPGIFAATVHTDQLTATYYRYEPGSSWEAHSHPQDQITSVLVGEIDFILAGDAVTLRAGQCAALPGGMPHAAKVGDQGAETLNFWTLRR